VREYAIIQGGQVVNIVMTSKPRDELIPVFRGHVVPIEQVPEDQLAAYGYWDERP
jgi:hypothetical protein